MSRRNLAWRMPPLPSKIIFKRGSDKAAQLLEILRAITVENQQEEAQVFYPIRDVARRFRVPVSTVARIYGQLEDEGILASVRGSKTLLQGRSSGRHLSVLGFVGMPASTPSFVTVQDYRTFFIRTRRELRARGFAVATMFYEPGDLQSGRVVSRINKYDVDVILWHEPGSAAKEAILQLKDTGIRIVGVSDRGFPAIRCRYEVQREGAIRTILRDWRSQAGITLVVIVRGIQTSAAMEEMLRRLLEEEELEHEFKSAGSETLEDFLKLIGRKERTGIIFSSLAASMFTFRVPEAVAKLMRRVRVAFIGGPASIPFVQVPDAQADLVVVDWQLVAEQIVTDLISKTAFDQAAITVFQAQACLHAPLIQYAQSL